MVPRVPLHGPTPFGVGTPLIESLTGFIGRLAVARHLTSPVIFHHLVRPLVSEEVVKERSRLAGFLARSAVGYDGLGEPAEELVGALTHLTGLENLRLHTLLPWRPLLPVKGNGALYWGWKRWCASCLAQWRAEGSVLWEPLLWRVASVRRCPVHRTPFSEVCPKCKGFQGLVQELVPFGMCRRCRHPLDAGDPWVRSGSKASFENDEARREWWLSVEVGRMLAFQGMVSAFPNPEGFSLLLKESIARPDVGSIRGLVRHLGVVRGSVLPWMRGERLPNLESFLLVCMRLSADPLRVAIVPRVELPEESLCRKDGAPFPWPLIRRELTGHRGRYGPGFWARADKKLSALLAESDAGRRSATQVAKALGITNKTLKKYYPTEYARLLDLHEAYRKRERERKFAQHRDKLRAAVLACVREGVYPRQDWVFQRAGFSRHLSCNPEYRQVWLSALYEYGIKAG